MNKQEIENKLEQAIKDRQGINDNILWLKEQLAEAEKPELRHGDCGLVWDEGEKEKPSRFVVTNHKGNLHWCRHSGLPSLIPLFHLTDYKYTILGNIFDLLNEWSEDLERFEFDVHEYEIRPYVQSYAPIKVAGNWHTLAEAEEIWHKLGQMIATLKRKLQAKAHKE
jgi:hypothetical protein